MDGGKVAGVIFLAFWFLLGITSLFLGCVLLIGTWVIEGDLLMKLKCGVFCLVMIMCGLWFFACLVEWLDKGVF